MIFLNLSNFLITFLQYNVIIILNLTLLKLLEIRVKTRVSMKIGMDLFLIKHLGAKLQACNNSFDLYQNFVVVD